MSQPTVKSLHVYPIKSTAGIELSHSWVDDFGLSFDRRFVITDMNGQFITARTQPSLCLIQCHITTTGLTLTAPNMPTLKVIFDHFSEQYHQVVVWKDTIDALYCHQRYDKWFSDYVKVPCQLHYFGDKSTRHVKNSDQQVGFADGYPLLIISQASLDNLNSRLTTTQVSMTQFRPNIVVNNTEAFEEDTWQHIRIGEVEFNVVKPCSRCVFTTVDPETGQKHGTQEPLTTLKKYRQVASGEVMFGQNLIALNNGSIKQTDVIEILSTQPKLNFAAPKTDNHLANQETPTHLIDSSNIGKASSPQPVKTIPKKVSLHFDSWGKHYQGNTNESILDQGEAAGLILPYSCRGGMCGRCKIKLTSGSVKQLADDGLTDEEREQGYVLACSTIPQSDLVLNSK